MDAIEQAGKIRLGEGVEAYRMAYGALHLLNAGLDAYGPPAAGVDATAILRHAVDLGINMIDTADIYGPGTNEEQIAAALHPYPPGLTISTKAGLTRPRSGVLVPDNRPEHLRAAVEGSLRRLKIDHIDIWNLHRWDQKVPIEDVAGTLGDLHGEGKLRNVGVSEVTVEQLMKFRQFVPIATVQNLFNVADRQNDPVVDYCEAEDIGFMAYFPLAHGRFNLLKYCVSDIAQAKNASIQQIALAWLLHRSPVIIPLPGTGIKAELEANVAACAITLSADEMAAIDARYAELEPISQKSSTVQQNENH